MTIVREVSDAMDLVAKTIANGRQIVAALHDARAYLRSRYPSANEDLAGLLTEMRKTLLGLARVSDVVTDFRFTISGPARDLELARFNELVIDRKSRLVEFDQSISALKGSSGRMRNYAEALTKGSGVPSGSCSTSRGWVSSVPRTWARSSTTCTSLTKISSTCSRHC